MTSASRAAPVYMLGQSADETRRLILQSAMLAPFTRRFLHNAGITDGMRVLDVGSGAGDVAMLAAELVGPRGSVVGMDRDAGVLAIARERAREAGLDNLSFMQGDIQTVVPGGEFDAVVGRLVLIFTPDPAEALRTLSRQVRPGGIVAFQEWHMTPWSLQSSPPLPLWQQVWHWNVATMRGAGVHLDLGYGLHRAFQAAGLPAPRMEIDAPLIRGDDPGQFEWVANTLRNMLPLTLELDVASAHEIAIDTLAERLREEMLAADAVVRIADLVGAWARTPARTPDDLGDDRTLHQEGEAR
jgi:SAM-dependent methyltransferase